MQAKQGDYRGCYIEKTKEALHNSEKERANDRK